MRWSALVLIGFFLTLGCAEQDPTAPPSGWQATEARWWQEEVDTAEVFRNLEDLVAMGVVDEKVAVGQGGQLTQEQFTRSIKQSLLPLYRNNPEIVDSLFNEYAAPELQDADLSGELLTPEGALKTKIRDKWQKAAYEAINEHYREPQQEEGASNIAYPESLRTEEGTLQLQAHVDTTGQIDAIEVLESVHPTLDAIGMKAAITGSNWEPAYLLRDGEWVPQSSWVRFDIPFQLPGN